MEFITMVPTARLELAQLSPLPPQDSVSTNFTTSAEHKNTPLTVSYWNDFNLMKDQRICAPNSCAF